ncbi:MAG: FAD-dependent oxidoreductase [Proteobacteria bacterium]|nr:FAD-dependent oxidoreductase [Pseudomonadota bacterium]
MAELKRLLEPGYIKKVKIKNRVSMAPMERQWGDRNGNVTQMYIDYLVERAKNGVGMITVESSFIDVVGRGNIYQLGLHDDAVIPSHKKMTDALHKHGTVVVTELHHGSRNAAIFKTGFQPVAPSPVPCAVAGGDLPRELTVGEIKELVNKYGEAAKRARKAGYDMITLHGAHGYLLNSFLSPFSNKRTDEYGGTPEKRWRFGIEVYEAVRAAIGDDCPLGYRITADEFVEGGLTLDDTKAFAQKLEELGLDYIDVSAGIYESAGMIIPTMDLPIGCLMPLAAGMKAVLDIPVIATGRINDPVFAEKILEKNEADYINMLRAFHADSEILIKAQKGEMDDICMCMACNKCIDLMFGQERVRCLVNPSAGREREFQLKPAKDKKKVMVIGGGLAGMEAARIAALRGHDVSLFEKDEELGGAVRWASKGKYREEWFQTARYRIHSVKTSGVKVHLGKEVSLPDVLAFKPDAAIVATGTIPFIPPYPGVNQPIVATHVDVLLGKRPIGKKAVVVGGKDAGLIMAEFLSENGCKVTVVEDSDALGADLGGIKGMLILPRIEEDANIDVKLKANVEAIGEDWVEIQSEGKREKINGLDMVAFAWAKDMVRQLADDIAVDGTVPEVYLIGDAVWPRDALETIYEGAVTGRRI